MNVQCISQRPGHIDVIYGTGPWAFEEVKDVPDDTAKKMLAHVDVYKRPEATTSVVPTVTPELPIFDPMQEFYDSLGSMNIAQMKTFIELQYGVKLDMSLYPNEQSLRAYTRQLVDQYGLR